MLQAVTHLRHEGAFGQEDLPLVVLDQLQGLPQHLQHVAHRVCAAPRAVHAAVQRGSRLEVVACGTACVNDLAVAWCCMVCRAGTAQCCCTSLLANLLHQQQLAGRAPSCCQACAAPPGMAWLSQTVTCRSSSSAEEQAQAALDSCSVPCSHIEPGCLRMRGHQCLHTEAGQSESSCALHARTLQLSMSHLRR